MAALAPHQNETTVYIILDRIAQHVANTLALLGGVVLLGLIVLTTLSIAGRALVPFDIGVGPIRGIYDYTEIGMAAAIFAFFPLAQYKDAHARVDLFQFLLSGKLNRVLDVLFHLTMTFVALVGTWRLYLGMLDKQSFNETTLIAQVPVWWGYAASLVGAGGFVFVAAFSVIRAVRCLVLAKETDA